MKRNILRKNLSSRLFKFVFYLSVDGSVLQTHLEQSVTPYHVFTEQFQEQLSTAPWYVCRGASSDSRGDMWHKGKTHNATCRRYVCACGVSDHPYSRSCRNSGYTCKWKEAIHAKQNLKSLYSVNVSIN